MPLAGQLQRSPLGAPPARPPDQYAGGYGRGFSAIGAVFESKVYYRQMIQPVHIVLAGATRAQPLKKGHEGKQK